MSSIFLIRHGQASFGTDNYDRLSTLGRRQAEVLGEYLEHAGIKFDAVISGSLERQRDTARIATGRDPDRVDARFNETDNDAHFEHYAPMLVKQHPELEELLERAKPHSRSFQLVLRRVFHHWVTTEEETPGMESWSSYSENAWQALSSLMKDYGRGVDLGLFTSGGTVATLVARVTGLPGTGVYQFFEPMINCSITRLVYNDDQVALQYYNDHSYFQVFGTQRDENLVTYR